MSISYPGNRDAGKFRPASSDRPGSRRALPTLTAITRAFRRSIRVRFVFALACALLGITLTAAVWKASQYALLSTFEHTVHEVRTDITPSHNIAVSLLEAERLVRLYEKDQSPALATEFELAADTIESNFLMFVGHLTSFAEHQDDIDVHLMVSAYDAWQGARQAASGVFARKLETPAFSAAFHDTTTGLESAYAATSEFYRRTVSEIERHLSNGQAVSSWAGYVMMSAILAGYLILILTSLYVCRSILHPIESLQEGARRLGKRDFAHRVRLHNKADELGQLGRAFNVAAASLQRVYRELEHRSTRDGLTGALNRAAFTERLSADCASADRHERPLSLLMVDIDFFKRINDTHGHQAGDRILQDVVELMENTIRPGEVVARYGGEEFAVILPDTDEREAVATADRLRRAVERQLFDCGAAEPITVTVSIGCACRQPDAMPSEDLIESADAALYQAKRTGRNRVVTAQPETGTPSHPVALASVA